MPTIALPANNFVNPFQIWSSVIDFLDQNSLCNLAQCNKNLRDISEAKLYANVHLVPEPVLKTGQWFIDTNETYVFGYRSMIKSNDQNDIYLYDKIERLIESKKLSKVKKIVIGKKLFSDAASGHAVLKRLLNGLLPLKKAHTIEIQDEYLFNAYYGSILKVSQSLCTLRLKSLADLGHVHSSCTTLQIDSAFGSETGTIIQTFDQIETLVLSNFDALSILQFLQSKGIVLKNVKNLTLYHQHDSNTKPWHIESLLKVIPLEKLKTLEIGFSCEVDECECSQTFFSTLGPLLLNLSELSLIEKSIETPTHHNSKEKWDIDVNHFIIELPEFGAHLKKLSIMHNIPANGQIADSVDGNYFRRRRMYEQMLPHLINLEVLIAPTFIQSLSCFEVLSCDFLWNGCRCPFCQKVLAVMDKYIHNHVFFNDWFADFKDIGPINLVAYASSFLSNRLISKDHNQLKVFGEAPLDVHWDFHGFDSIGHYKGYTCFFDESAFKPLAVCFQHFTDTYMEYIVHFLPKLKFCCLSGIYYYIEDHAFHSVYDNAV